MNFIKTKDEETYKKLLAEGFQLISKDGEIYTFANNGSNFSSADDKKIVYTNVLFG